MTKQVRFGLALVLACILTVSALIYVGFDNYPSASIRRADTRNTMQMNTPVHVNAMDATNHKMGGITAATMQPDHTIVPISLKTKTTAKAPPVTIVHVTKGQCLWTIAQTYKTTVKNIITENRLKTDVLQIGQVLRIPRVTVKPTAAVKMASDKPKQKPVTTQTTNYTVHAGDSLWKIALAYGVTVNQLRADNHLTSNAIHLGQKIVIHAPKAQFHLTAASRKLIEQAPAKLLPVYKAAAKKYGIPWTVLAAIHKEETDFCITNAPESSAGALGPMQFEPETFRTYGVAAPGHRYPNINNVEDAIYSAAHMLAAKGFQRNPYHAIYDYNQSTVYVHDILRMSAV